MNRRTFIKNGAATFFSLPLLNAACPEWRKPNIILILADDLGYGALSCFGQKQYETPNIDRLAEHGMTFFQHYAGSPVCAPSRCVCLTGKHTGHAYVRGNKQAEPSGQLPLPAEETTFAEPLRQSGYRTGCFGKWGLGIAGSSGDPQNHGFETFFGYYDQVLAHNSYPEFLYKNGKKVFLDNTVKYVSTDHWSKGLGSYSVEKNEYANDLILNAALEFIESHQQEPFFLYYPTTIPHNNGEAPQGERFEVPDTGAFAEQSWTAAEKDYAALIKKLDSQVGILEKKIRELGLEQETVIFFTSDNGAIKHDQLLKRFRSNGPFRGAKRDLYEGGIRVPLIVKWPGQIKAGSVCDHVSAFQDFFPTLCEIAAAEQGHDIDGISFLPALLNQKQKTHPYLYWEFHWWNPSRRAVRFGPWKAVQNGVKNDIELYNLQSDPAEQQNVAEQRPQIIRRVKEIFHKAHQPSDLWSLAG